MHSGILKRNTRAVLLLVSLLATSAVHAITGTISGQGSETLASSDCGSDSDFGPFTITLRTGRKWRMTDDAGVVYTGSFTADSSQRNVVLNLDSTSEARLIGVLKRWGTQLCGTNVKVKSYSRPVVKIRFNAGFTAASGKLSMSLTGKSDAGSGTGRYTAQFSNASFKGKP